MRRLSGRSMTMLCNILQPAQPASDRGQAVDKGDLDEMMPQRHRPRGDALAQLTGERRGHACIRIAITSSDVNVDAAMTAPASVTEGVRWNAGERPVDSCGTRVLRDGIIPSASASGTCPSTDRPRNPSNAQTCQSLADLCTTGRSVHETPDRPPPCTAPTATRAAAPPRRPPPRPRAARSHRGRTPATGSIARPSPPRPRG